VDKVQIREHKNQIGAHRKQMCLRPQEPVNKKRIKNKIKLIIQGHKQHITIFKMLLHTPPEHTKNQIRANENQIRANKNK